MRMKTDTNRNSKGQFVRVHKQWSLDNFDDGYVDSDGRMRVYFPGHPRTYGEDYVLRSIVAYETYHSVKVAKGNNIHHINENRLDDSKENLQLMEHGAHSVFHNKKPLVKCVCINCGNEFFLPQWRINEGRGKYCSQTCYHLDKKRSINERIY